MIETKFKQTDIGKIPNDWSVQSLGEIGEVKMCRRIFKEQTLSVGDIPFYKIGTFGKEPDAFISRQLFENYRNLYPYPVIGTPLLSAAGTIGRVVRYNGEDSYFQDSNIIWLEHDSSIVSNEYLCYCYKTISWLTETGAAISRLYNSNLLATKIAVPSRNEQIRIANALSDVDALLVSLDKLIAKKKAIKQGSMQQLLIGKQRLKGYDKPWVSFRIEELFDLGNGYTPSKEVASYWNNGTIPWFRMEDIRTNGRILKDSIQHITKKAVKGGGLFPAGSFILSTTATIGEHALLIADSLANQRFTFLNRKVNRVSDIDQMFFFHYLFIIGDWCRANINDGGLLAVNMTDLKNYECKIPPTLDEQCAIASILTDMDAEITELESKKAKYTAIKQGMMQQLLTGKIRLI
jgi:type I restriction enzyme, S subunit